MMIPLIDVILLILLSGFIFYGFFFGFIRAVGSFVGVIIAAVLASRLYLPTSVLADRFFFGYNNLGKVLAFLILFSLIYKLVGLAFYLIDRIFSIFTIIPFMKTFNRLGGAVLGFISGSLFIGIILYVISRYAILETLAGKWLVGSQVAPWFVKWAKLILPLLPDFLKKLQALI